MLNPDSPVPLYHQLAEILTEMIRSGKYQAGDRIPSEPQLAKTYQIGRPTARQALELMVQKGYVKRKQGSGTFVRSPRDEVDLLSLAGTICSFREKGISVGTQILMPLELTLVERDSENPFYGQRAFHFTRLSSVDGNPVLLEELYLHPTLFKDIDRIDMSGQSLSEIVRDRYYMRPESGKQNFRIGFLMGERARLLDVSSDTPILLVKRFLHFPRQKNAIYSVIYCKTDQFVFSQNLGGMTDA